MMKVNRVSFTDKNQNEYYCKCCFYGRNNDSKDKIISFCNEVKIAYSIAAGSTILVHDHFGRLVICLPGETVVLSEMGEIFVFSACDMQNMGASYVQEETED